MSKTKPPAADDGPPDTVVLNLNEIFELLANLANEVEYNEHERIILQNARFLQQKLELEGFFHDITVVAHPLGRYSVKLTGAEDPTEDCITLDVGVYGEVRVVRHRRLRPRGTELTNLEI